MHQWNASGIRIGLFRIGTKRCDTFLTCELDFVPTLNLGEQVRRMREIEGQAALSRLYRERLEAMKVRRQRDRSN